MGAIVKEVLARIEGLRVIFGIIVTEGQLVRIDCLGQGRIAVMQMMTTLRKFRLALNIFEIIAIPGVNADITFARGVHKLILVKFRAHPGMELLVVTNFENGASADFHELTTVVFDEERLLRVVHRVNHRVLSGKKFVAVDNQGVMLGIVCSLWRRLLWDLNHTAALFFHLLLLVKILIHLLEVASFLKVSDEDWKVR